MSLSVSKMNKIPTIGELEELVLQCIVYEISQNLHKYNIEQWKIPVLNPLPYINHRVEGIRRALMKCVLNNLLSRQCTQTKIFLMKVIDKQLMDYLNHFKKSVIQDHYKSWYTICVLEEMRQK